MKTIQMRTIDLICEEMANIPEKYAQTNFNSTHEAIAVIREEYLELEKEVFWGEKECLEIYEAVGESEALEFHKDRMRSEAIQLAAMCVRFVQELT